MRKRLTSFLLCFFLCVSLLPVSAQATETAEVNTPEIPTEGDVWDGSITQPTKLVQKDGVNYYEITKCAELAYIAQTGGNWLEYNYILGNNLLLNDVLLTWDNDGNLTNTEPLLQWQSIGSREKHFSGLFDGNNFTISGLYSRDTGLFRYVENTTISNLKISNAYIFAKNYENIGGIVGHMSHGLCYNCSYNGIIIGYKTQPTGGICAYPAQSTVDSCSFKGVIIGGKDVGGIAGFSLSTSIANCCVCAEITGSEDTGGVVGRLTYANVEKSCYSGRLVSSESYSGGIVGLLNDGTASNCYSIAAIEGISNVGGIAGKCEDTITNCYSASTVEGDNTLGGIVGNDSGVWNGDTSYSNCYYLKYVGYNDSIMGNGSASGDIAGEISSITLNELKTKSTFNEWNFESIWFIAADKNGGYPYLQWQENALSDIAVNDVEISETALALTEGDYAYLTATVSPFNASNQSVTWKSSNSNIATVSAAGKVTAVSAGIAVITVTTVDGGYSVSCAVTVTDRLAEEYRINSITVRDNDGAVLSAISNGNCLATVSITNLASEGNTLVFLAAYTSTGQYQGMMWVSVEDLPIGATIKVTLPVDNSDGKIENLKAFTIASFSNLTPLGEAVSFLP